MKTTTEPKPQLRIRGDGDACADVILFAKAIHMAIDQIGCIQAGQNPIN